jgi:hypothetical protein
VGLYGLFCLIAGALLLLRDFSSLKRISAIFGVGVLIGLPYLVMVKTSMAQNQFLVTRISVATRAVSWVGAGIISLSLLALYGKVRDEHFARSRDSKLNPWMLMLLIGAFGGAGIGLNFQVLSGSDANHSAHFMNKIIQPMTVLLFFVSLAFLTKEKGKRYLEPVFLISLVAMLGVATFRQIRVGIHVAKTNNTNTSIINLTQWIEKNITPDKIIGSSEGRFITQIPARTGNFNYVPVAFRTRASDLEILNRFLFISWLENKNPEEIWNNLLSDESHRISFGYMLLGRPPTQWDKEYCELTWKKIDSGQLTMPGTMDYLIVRKGQSVERFKKLYRSMSVLYENAEWSFLSVKS